MLERLRPQLDALGPLAERDRRADADGAAAHLDVLINVPGKGFTACLLLHLVQDPSKIMLLLLLESLYQGCEVSFLGLAVVISSKPISQSFNKE